MNIDKKSHNYKGNNHIFFTDTIYDSTYECSDYMYNRLLKIMKENQMTIV